MIPWTLISHIFSCSFFRMFLIRNATGQPSAQTKCWSRSGNDMGSDLFPPLFIFATYLSTFNNDDDSYNIIHT